MGEAARRRQIRKEAERRRPELEKMLREQYELLELDAKTFDGGRPTVALRMAVQIRVLVHDTANSISLLELLGLKTSIPFLDTAQHIDPRNLLGNPGIAPLDMSRPAGPAREVRFSEWWTTEIVKDNTGATWSRKDFVLYMANKLGGAHVDPRVTDDALEALSNDNSLGWTYSDPFTANSPMINGPVLPSVRQITYELLASLAPVLHNMSQ
jgi:hypothetical protein